jgi:hypothetical protein
VAAENQPLRFKIEDVEYEVPILDDLDLDEWQILYDYTGLILEDFAPQEDEETEKDRQRRTSQPGFTRAMLHIGYRRTHPELKPDAIKKVTGEAKLLHVLEAFGEAPDEEDETPLASTIEPEKSSPQSSVDSNETEPASSPKNSDQPAIQRVPTGTAG